MINHPRGNIRLSPCREASRFWVGQEMHCISWNTKLVTVLLCYHVTKSPQTVLILIKTNLFGSIYFTIISCIVILFFHLLLFQPSEFFPSFFSCALLNAFLNPVIALTCSPKSPHLFFSTWWYLWTDRILEFVW